LTYINDILPKNVQIKDGEVINDSVKSFFKELGKILKDTPKRTMANYAMWRITKSATSFLTDTLRKRQLKYSTEVSGIQGIQPRWKECVSVTTSNLKISVAALYIRQFFLENAKKAALEMVQDIKEVFEGILQTVDWMDAITRKKALEKVKDMAIHIGYPDELMDNKKLEAYYEGLEIDSNQYLESILRVGQFGTDKSYLKLREPVNKTDWTTHSKAAIVNAFYSPIENSIREYDLKKRTPEY
jgi:neprilysin